MPEISDDAETIAAKLDEVAAEFDSYSKEELAVWLERAASIIRDLGIMKDADLYLLDVPPQGSA